MIYQHTDTENIIANPTGNALRPAKRPVRWDDQVLCGCCTLYNPLGETIPCAADGCCCRTSRIGFRPYSVQRARYTRTQVSELARTIIRDHHFTANRVRPQPCLTYIIVFVSLILCRTVLRVPNLTWPRVLGIHRPQKNDTPRASQQCSVDYLLESRSTFGCCPRVSLNVSDRLRYSLRRFNFRRDFFLGKQTATYLDVLFVFRFFVNKIKDFARIQNNNTVL